MKLHLIVEDPDPAFQRALLALLGEHAGSLKTAGPATDWADPETASRYYLSLPATAQRILREAATREDGYVPADVLRGPHGEGKLTGSSGAFKAALKRGVRRNWWVADQVSPLLAEGPGFGKVAGYRIRTGALPAFQAAVATHQQGELASQKDCLAEAITGEGGSGTRSAPSPRSTRSATPSTRSAPGRSCASSPQTASSSAWTPIELSTALLTTRNSRSPGGQTRPAPANPRRPTGWPWPRW
ncbi:hypothetical protein [Streptomyces sp. NBC_00162]|uniref:hypothetical protein n=1 Tax=Streptomyces sp. NBC_00162 TaxID=2903629 RepID=UPI00214B667E|nr:hypothetical protein [Streptomyces sp. NBC_00162]UUU37521.1 hypothetical protein JIW86_00380 [Streptomyces sp. NBC_00162]